jgi:hypothetical protein
LTKQKHYATILTINATLGSERAQRNGATATRTARGREKEPMNKISKSTSDGTTTCDLCGGVIADGNDVHTYSDHNSLCDDCNRVNIATEWKLWNEYMNASGAQTFEQWDAMSIDDRVALMIDCGF